MSAQDRGLGAKKIKGLAVVINRLARVDHRGDRSLCMGWQAGKTQVETCTPPKGW